MKEVASIIIVLLIISAIIGSAITGIVIYKDYSIYSRDEIELNSLDFYQEDETEYEIVIDEENETTILREKKTVLPQKEGSLSDLKYLSSLC